MISLYFLSWWHGYIFEVYVIFRCDVLCWDILCMSSWGIIQRRDVYFLIIYYNCVIYRFNRNRVLHRSAVRMVKKEWRPKCIWLITHTSLRESSSEDWYYDSGCSRHITGVDKFLENVIPYAKSYVTFGDGAKGKIVGIGNLVSEGSPRLDNVLLVKGLAANLISISQLCDQSLSVNFSKTATYGSLKNRLS